MIAILDYGLGNLRSVHKAFERVGAAAEVIADPAAVGRYEKLVLPGVGNFADGMALLRGRGFVEPVREAVAAGVPTLGVCMGMQLLMDSSTEDAPCDDEPVPGLGIVPGRVIRFREDGAEGFGGDGGHLAATRLKVPHMGWNRLDPTPPRQGTDGHPLTADLGPDPYVYFVHGYYCVPDDPAVTVATATYGRPFCAALQQGHVWACQFHPEKSQSVGLQILTNFARC